MNDATALITDAKRIIVIQAENPDGDSAGAALGLEAILNDLGKGVQLHCPVELPKYLRYIDGWDRVVPDFDTNADLSIIVDTSSETLLSKTLEIPGARHFFETHPVIIIDHHAETGAELPFPVIDISNPTAIAASQVVADLAVANNWPLARDGALALLSGVLSDSLGLSTPNVTPESLQTVIYLMNAGAHPAIIEEKRREFMKKSPRIAAYKGQLLTRIEYDCDGELAVVHVPWEDIETYSNEYNPGALVVDELRFITGVQLAVVLKTYPDGRVTAKIKGNLPIAADVAGYFGGGGHGYAAGFRAYDDYETIRHELITAYQRAKQEYDHGAAV